MRGTIRQRGEGRYELQVFLGRDPLTDRRRFRTETFHGLRVDAESRLAELVAETVNRPRRAPAKTITVADLHAAWSSVVDHEKSNAYNRESRWRTYIEPTLGAKKLRSLTTLDLDRLYRHLARRGSRTGGPLGASTVRRVHNDLSSMLARAVKWGWINTNPAVDAEPPTVPTRRPKAPSTRQVRYLLELAATTSPQLAAFIRVSAATGARRGEVHALRWNHIIWSADGGDDDGWGDDPVDVDAIPDGGAAIVIDGAVGVAGGSIYLKGTKTGDQRPAVIVDPGTAAVLREHRVRAARLALLRGVTLADDAFVFTLDPAGRTPWLPSSASHEFARLRRAAVARIIGDLEHDIAPDPSVPDRHRERFAAAVARVQLRQLRHFVATQLGGAGIAMTTISARLGHARTSTTSDFYSGVLAAPDQQAAVVLGALLDGTG